MARKRRLPFDCFACGKCFKSAQAVRGHRRHCRYPRLGREAEAQAVAQPESPIAQRSSGSTTRGRPQLAPGGDADQIRRRPGPLSYETKLLLLQVQAAIEELHEDAREFGGMINQFARMNVTGCHEQAQDCARMSLALDDCLRELDPMVPAFQMDRGTMYQIYRTMCWLKELWLTQLIRACRFVEMAPDGVDAESRQMLRDEGARFTRIVEHLQHLVAAAP